jgi:hypothetical protein
MGLLVIREYDVMITDSIFLLSEDFRFERGLIWQALVLVNGEGMADSPEGRSWTFLVVFYYSSIQNEY